MGKNKTLNSTVKRNIKSNFISFKVPKLEVYVIHCANQIRAKSVLDEKRSSDPRVEDFLTRCLESPFSRRLDVWSYLGNRLKRYIFNLGSYQNNL